MMDANFKSSIYIRNNNEREAITATPILYLSNGKKFTLPDVVVAPAGTVVLSVNDALRNQGIASWATLSGYVEVQYTWRYDPLCVIVNNIDVVHSLIFTSGLRSALPPPAAVNKQPVSTNAMEGMWWKEESNVTGFVALSNTATQPRRAALQVTDGGGRSLGEQSVLIAPHGTKIVHLEELQSTATESGGLRVSYEGPNESLIVTGHLEDEAAGYSASIPFTHAPSGSEQSTTTSFGELGLMSGAADPMLSFPAGTVFTPFSVIRNISDSSVSVKPHLFWMEAGKARSAALNGFALPPQQTRTLDVAALLAEGGLQSFNGSVNLTLDVQGKEHSVLVASGSVDQRKTYVFQGVPRAIQQSQAKTISYWSTGNGDDTMVTVWNPADEAQDFIFTLYFSGGDYEFPIHLEPRATRMLNISEIIQNQIPDRNGNIIPASVHEGSAKLAGSLGEVQDILVALDAGTYNVRKATCSYYCITCAGYYDLLLGIVPYSVLKGGTSQLNLTGEYSSGSNINLNSAATWSSTNTAVATVATGLVKGMGAGSATMDTLDNEPLASQYCAYDPQSCTGPYQNFTNSGGGGVPANPTISAVSFSGGLALGAGGLMTVTGSNFSSFLGAVSVVFDQGVTTSNVTVNTTNNIITANYQVTCATVVGFHTFVVSSAGGDGGAGAETAPWSVSVTLPSLPVAGILFGGNNVTGKTTSVVVGQQIALSNSVSLPACVSVTGQQWSVPSGSAVGGFSASSTSGSVVALPANTTPTYTFHWVSPNSSGATMTYQYTISGGGSSASSPIASATFTVAGPTVSSMSTPTGSVGIFAGPKLGFGPVGIKFTATTTTPSGDTGQFRFAQLITNDTLTLTTTSGTVQTCVNKTQPATTSGTGLDTQYPYATGTTTQDSPSVGLNSSTYNKEARAFSAKMYFLWDPALPAGCTVGSSCTSIPVPLGSITWGWSGTATYSSSSGTWSLTTSSKTTPSWSTGASYPTWSDYVPYTLGLSCH